MTPSPADPHVPGPSLWPIVLAVGVALILIGVIVSPAIVVTLGVVVVAIALFGWARDAKAGHAPAPELEPETRTPAESATPAAEGEPPASEEEDEHTYPRSVFLEGATLGLGAVIGGLVAVPALGFAVLPAFTKQHKISADVGPVSNFPEGQWRITTFMTDPAIGEVSRQTAFIRQNAPVKVNGKLEPSFTVLSNHCAHLGCPVQPAGPHQDNQATKLTTTAGEITLIPMQPSGFSCPCHGGAYDTEGNRTGGPPVRALDRFSFSVLKGRLILQKPYSVGKVKGTGGNAEIWKYPQHNPGQHVDGVERFFYPVQPPR